MSTNDENDDNNNNNNTPMTSFASYLPIHLPYLHFPHSHHSVIINIRQTCLPLPVYKILQCQLLAPTNLHLTLPRPELPRSLKCSNPLSAKPKREAITITMSHPPVTVEEATAAVHAPHQRCSDRNLGGTAQRLQPRGHQPAPASLTPRIMS